MDHLKSLGLYPEGIEKLLKDFMEGSQMVKFAIQKDHLSAVQRKDVEKVKKGCWKATCEKIVAVQVRGGGVYNKQNVQRQKEVDPFMVASNVESSAEVTMPMYPHLRNASKAQPSASRNLMQSWKNCTSSTCSFQPGGIQEFRCFMGIHGQFCNKECFQWKLETQEYSAIG